jgi:integrase
VRQEIAALLLTLCHRAQVQTRLTPHRLRPTFITLALNDGAALPDGRDVARHAEPHTTRLYDRDAGALNCHPVAPAAGAHSRRQPSMIPTGPAPTPRRQL